ncbi:PEP-CTERM sorting domain-containing protein [Roseateles sp. NT4]|uniref:PEP-CTERM sorting domain-containing protein n=1 Tax=Roseateles sp. NT4 TaxID=3453715 RepID=UPI003EF0459E
MRFAPTLFCLALAAAATGASAVPTAISNAAFAATYVRDCRSPAAQTAGSTTPDRCEAALDASGQPIFRPIIEQNSQMTIGGTSAATSATNPIGAHGGQVTRSSIDASGAAGVLILKQGAFAGDYARVSGHSVGLQSFQYTGTTPEVRSVHNVLDFSSNVTPTAILDLPGDADLGTTNASVYAKTRVTVFSLLTSSFDFDNDPTLGFDPQASGFWSQASGRADFRLEGQVDNTGITASGTATDIDFTVEAGRYYFVESYLGLWARFGGELDATHTFTSTLGEKDASGAFVADASDFTAAAALDAPIVINAGNVPEPATLALSGLAFAALLGQRRRAQRKSASSTTR